MSLQYADYALWQREHLQGEVLETQKAYWLTHLQGAPEQLTLPTDFPRPAASSHRGGRHYFHLDKSVSTALQALGQAHGATPFMTLLSTFYALLSRYSGQSELVVGTPIANRQYQETEALIGFFVNTLALRVQLGPGTSFKALLDQVIQITQSAHDHQDLPFEQLVDDLNIPRRLNQQPLFQVMFTHQPQAKDSPLHFQGLSLSPFETPYDIAKFDLTLSSVDTSEGLDFSLEYATDLFKPETIARMAEHFKQLITHCVHAPELPLAAHDLLTPAERHTQLVAWNQTARDYPVQTIQALFEAQVDKNPENIAVVFEGDTLTYRELNARANQLAHYLRTQGVGPDTLVALSLERSLELIVGLLGILKAGGAYVPLDPDYPEARLHFMLEDTNATLLLTQSHLQERFATSPTPALCLDTDWATRINPEPAHNPEPTATPEHLAYVIYTSGSTGQPKGVMVEQAGVCALAQAQIKAFDMNSESRILQFASISFDAAATELTTTFACGASLYILSGNQKVLLDSLVQTCSQHAITVATLPPSVLTNLPEEALKSLQTLVVAGEACPAALAKRWRNKLNFINVYGPTEATVACAIYPLSNDLSSNAIPIGRPMPNRKLYVLNAALQPVPLGVAGELYIGGAGLARGYLNRPELTAERFIDNPFASEADKAQGKNSRLYKTGDLVKYLEDGNLVYLNRIDHQVKLRGYRIELGEIESALSQHPALKDAVVLAREDTPQQKRLVAYVIAHATEGSEATAVNSLSQTLRDHLSQQLPEYMVPQAFVTLDAWPLTPNGKLDHKALPAPETEHFALTEAYVAPRNAIEFKLIAIWQTLLNLVRVGIQDNFFEIGGHSLLLIQLISRIKFDFGKNIPIATAYRNPTVAQLAPLCVQNGIALTQELLLPIQTQGSNPPLFLVHPAGGNAFPYFSLAKYLSEQSVYGINNPRFTQPNNPFPSIEAMAECYIEAIQSIQPQGPYRLGGYSMGGTVALEMAQQLKQVGQNVDIVLLLDSTNQAVLSTETKQALLQNNKVIMETILDKQIENFPGEFDYIRTAQANSEKQIHHYQPKAYHGRVALLTAQAWDKTLDKQLQLPPVAQREWDVLKSDPTNGWGSFIEPALEIYSVPGDHQHILSPQYIQSTTEKMQQALNSHGLPSTLQNTRISKLERNYLHAAMNNDTFIVTWCLKQSVSVNVCDTEKYTALHWAAYHDNKALAQLLLRYHCDPNRQNRQGYTAHAWAEHQGYNELAAFLKPPLVKTEHHSVIKDPAPLGLQVQQADGGWAYYLRSGSEPHVCQEFRVGTEDEVSQHRLTLLPTRFAFFGQLTRAVVGQAMVAERGKITEEPLKMKWMGRLYQKLEASDIHKDPVQYDFATYLKMHTRLCELLQQALQPAMAIQPPRLLEGENLEAYLNRRIESVIDQYSRGFHR